jgi:hypothetical protein
VKPRTKGKKEKKPSWYLTEMMYEEEKEEEEEMDGYPEERMEKVK